MPASDLLDQNVARRDLWGKTADERAERLADSALAHAPRLLEDAILARRNVSAAALAALPGRPPARGLLLLVREVGQPVEDRHQGTVMPATLTTSLARVGWLAPGVHTSATGSAWLEMLTIHTSGLPAYLAAGSLMPTSLA